MIDWIPTFLSSIAPSLILKFLLVIVVLWNYCISETPTSSGSISFKKKIFRPIEVYSLHF